MAANSRPAKSRPIPRPTWRLCDRGGQLSRGTAGTSSEVEVGDWVLALGQPFGLEGTVTAGIVSAKGRGLGITDREDFIQTDAAINPGNSGGPLVNLDGEVIGINTAISTSSGGYQGVGFAVPIDLAKWVGGQLEQSGTVHRAYLGVMISPVNQEVAEQFKIKVHSGVWVREVRDNTPAAKAGVQPGDVIMKFAGQAVNTRGSCRISWNGRPSEARSRWSCSATARS